MKLSQLKEIESSIPKLINIDLPIKYAYRLNMIMDDVHTHIGKIQEARIQYFERHGELIEGTTKYRMSMEQMQEFDKDIDELLQMETGIEPVPIPLSLLIEQPITFTVLEIEALKNSGFLIDDINSSEE
jgi:hypothetical protein